jgi:hypothetical protein
VLGVVIDGACAVALALRLGAAHEISYFRSVFARVKRANVARLLSESRQYRHGTTFSDVLNLFVFNSGYIE